MFDPGKIHSLAYAHRAGQTQKGQSPRPADVGNQAFVPYTADYFFYQKAS
jgi:hypothetical protein